ncbi:MAG: hypothetical protein LC746_08105, partial [Acidobacteria bacterium]|nr:hypothetical protein [Acidobacteriota bacterium]
HVLLFEDMRANPRDFMKNLAARIWIDPSFYDAYDFRARNETYGVRYRALHRGARRLNRLAPSWGLKAALKTVYVKAQSGGDGGGKTPEDARALADLEREFRPFNARLAAEFGLDLSAWE